MEKWWSEGTIWQKYTTEKLSQSRNKHCSRNCQTFNLKLKQSWFPLCSFICCWMTNPTDILYSDYLFDTGTLVICILKSWISCLCGRVLLVGRSRWNTFLCMNEFRLYDHITANSSQPTLCVLYVLRDLRGGGVDRGEGDAGVCGAQAQFSGRGGEQVSQCGALLGAVGHQRWSFTVQRFQSVCALFLHLPYSWLLILCRRRHRAITLTTPKNVLSNVYSRFIIKEKKKRNLRGMFIRNGWGVEKKNCVLHSLCFTLHNTCLSSWMDLLITWHIKSSNQRKCAGHLVPDPWLRACHWYNNRCNVTQFSSEKALRVEICKWAAFVQFKTMTKAHISDIHLTGAPF